MTMTEFATKLGWSLEETSLWARAADGTPVELPIDLRGVREPTEADLTVFALARAVRTKEQGVSRRDALLVASEHREGAKYVLLARRALKTFQPDSETIVRWLEALPVMAELFSVTLDSPRAATQLASKVKNTIGISNSIFKPGSRK